ncbi:acetyltransferase [Streptomyces sp. WM6372]|uniref:GNAT family N-acetyltransferase n=1 Tax=Streptomyces sp. WM6372 TaxID=1415555 RepID=UPI0006AE0D21|nr:GNAT family protein [Streptomyces sp. WM6372]KOU25656.1 acetyltransferase [Streptomyces sp. WM6372]
MSFSTYLREGEHVGLRPFRLADGPEFTARVHESRHLHHPWLSPPATTEEYEAYATPLIEGTGRVGFLVCERGTGAIAGFVNINNIVNGAFDCGALGYGAFAHAAGRGLFREALGLVVVQAFAPEDEGGLGLHRLEANVQPGNAASLALVRGAGFRKEGFSPEFLFVDGSWRDHERWAITAEMSGPAAADRAG